MAEIINGKELAKNIRLELKNEVSKLKEKGIIPKLAVIMVGDDKASKVYVKNKSKACEEIGIEYEEFLLDENISMEELLNLIEKLNNRKDINGILLQIADLSTKVQVIKNKRYQKNLLKNSIEGKQVQPEIIKKSFGLLKNKEFNKTLSSFAATLDSTKIISSNLSKPSETNSST